ncbi:MAG: hypothetical protein A2Z20_10460 [Bdellovibrionales bacterium RBG_16_40_8]|nr:MAG: hypothetical protein A2Z20_10460 [Bdellovibrionales bacterium RBG_16_40_8]
MSEGSGDNKVVPFPSHKVRPTKVEGVTEKVRPIYLKHRAIFIMALIFTVFLSTFIASRVNISREIASDLDRRDLQEDIILAKKISRESLRHPASSGREPTAEDILRHGEFLAGLYSLNFDDKGSLRGIAFSGPNGSEKYMQDRKDFIKINSDLMRIQFDNIKQSESIRDTKYIFEVYELTNGGTLAGRIHFKVDAENRLYSMQIESPTL